MRGGDIPNSAAAYEALIDGLGGVGGGGTARPRADAAGRRDDAPTLRPHRPPRVAH